jgi:hypothetical protein
MSKKTRSKSVASRVAAAMRAANQRGSYSAALSAPPSPSAIAAAMRAANQRGQYGAAIATNALVAQLGAMTRGLAKKPRRKLTAAEKAARKRVLAAHKSSAARAARLPGKKKRRTAKKTAKKRPVSGGTTPRARAADHAASRRASAPRRSKVPTVTANSVINGAAKAALKKWLCEGARRSGCGAGGSRVVSGKGSFVRIRPARIMTAG